MYGLFDAFARNANRLKVINARHEQTTAYMALGYAQSSGKPSAFTVVPGPGVMNTMGALTTAWGVNAPVMCITGQVPSAMIGRGRGQLHEMPDQLATLKTLLKFAERIEHPTEAPQVMARAFQAMTSGRPGPVAVEMPWDMFPATADVTPIDPLGKRANPEPDPDKIAALAKLVDAAKAPMIWIGGGAVDAGPEILALAEKIGAPVVSYRMGKGVVDSRHPLSLNTVGGFELWDKTDLLIGIGTRLDTPIARWAPAPAGLKTARIDLDPAEHRRLAVNVAIVADAADGTRALTAAVARKDGKDWRAAIATAKEAAQAAIAKADPQYSYMKVIRETLPDDGIVVDEVTQLGYIIWYGYPVHQPRRLVSSGFSGTLGYGFPTALGVKVGEPRPAGRVGDRRRRLPVRRLRSVDRQAVRHQPGDRAGEQRLLRQREARPGAALRGPPLRRGAAQSRLPGLCPLLRRAGLAGRDGRRLPRRAARGAGRRFAGGGRGRLGHRQGLSALQVPSTEVALMANAPTVERQRRAYVPDDAWLAKRPKEPILEPDLPIVDPHHHLWDHANHRYLLDELVADTGTGHNITATVYIDCRSMYRADGPKEMRPVGETEFVNGVAAMSASGLYGPTRACAGIISYVDMTLGARARDVLEAHIAAGNGRFRGIRHSGGWDPSPDVRNAHTNPPQGLYAQADYRAGVAELGKLGLTYEAWQYHPQVKEVTALAKAVPGTTMILNHCGGPLGIGPYAGKTDAVFAAWKADMAELARCPNVVVKLGGLGMDIGPFVEHMKRPAPPSSQEIADAWGPWIKTCIDAFGADRCMFESNFPVDKISNGYATLWNAFKLMAKGASASEKTDLFSGTAKRVYRLP